MMNGHPVEKALMDLMLEINRLGSRDVVMVGRADKKMIKIIMGELGIVLPIRFSFSLFFFHPPPFIKQIYECLI